MKVVHEKLLGRLGCPDASSAKDLHTCPRCHNLSMRVSYPQKTTYFICSECNMFFNALQIVSVCLNISKLEASRLFDEGQPLHDTLASDSDIIASTIYMDETRRQQDLETSRSASIGSMGKSKYKYKIEQMGITRGLGKDTGVIKSRTLKRMIKSGLITRISIDGRLPQESDNLVHFLRRGGRISGIEAVSLTNGVRSRYEVIGSESQFSIGDYKPWPEFTSCSEILFVFPKIEELLKFKARRSVYTKKPAPAVYLSGYELPVDCPYVSRVVIIPDGSREDDLTTFSSFMRMETPATYTDKPNMFVYDCKGDYELKAYDNMLLRAIPLTEWCANMLVREYCKEGKEAVESLLSRFPGFKKRAHDIAAHIPDSDNLRGLYQLVIGGHVAEKDIAYVSTIGNLQRTGNSILHHPLQQGAPVTRLTNFRVDILRRLSATEGAIGMHLRITCQSGNKYEVYAAPKRLNSYAGFLAWLGKNIPPPDGDNLDFLERNTKFTPSTLLAPFDTDVPFTNIPDSVDVYGDTIEFPRMRLNIYNGDISDQLSDMPVGKLPYTQGLAYSNLKRSYASLRRIWEDKNNPVSAGLALCLSHAAYAVLGAATAERGRLFASPPTLSVIMEDPDVSKRMLYALSYVINGGPSAYNIIRKSSTKVPSRYRAFPSISVMPRGPGSFYNAVDSAAIVFSHPFSSSKISIIDRPTYVVAGYKSGMDKRELKVSILEHLQASYPILLSDIIRELGDTSYRFLRGQKIPALYMYNLISDTFGFDRSELPSHMVCDNYSGPSVTVVDMFLSAVQHLTQGSNPVIKDTRYRNAKIFEKSDKYVKISKAIYGHIFRYCKERYIETPSADEFEEAIDMSRYGYVGPVSGRAQSKFWCISREAWDTRVANVRAYNAIINSRMRIVS